MKIGNPIVGPLSSTAFSRTDWATLIVMVSAAAAIRCIFYTGFLARTRLLTSKPPTTLLLVTGAHPITLGRPATA